MKPDEYGCGRSVSLCFSHLRLVLLLISIICSKSSIFAQDESIRPENVKIASPNAAALGKVADIPISYHTGIPNIDIPIYTVQEGPLQMPVSLSYHASGLKVIEQASWVGAGWSLNAGGMITRSVRGMPDEVLSSSGSPAPISYLNNHGYHDYLFWEIAGGEYVPQILPNAPSGSQQSLATYEFAHGRRDGEADMFNFNFGGYSGKFYFRPDNSVVLAPQQDIRVTPLFCSSGNPNCSQNNEYLYGWIVTTPDGVKYYFGKDLSQSGNYNSADNAVPMEHTTSYSATSGLSYSKTASSWYLNKVESPDKKFSISLQYSAENYSYYTTSLSPQSSFGSAPNSIDLVKNIMTGVRLAAIKFSNGGQVTFIPSTFVRADLSGLNTNLYDFDPDPQNATAPRALGEIEISFNTGSDTTFCQTFIFNYDYFSDSNPLTGYLANLASQFNLHSDKKRLKLENITEKSCDGSVAKPPHVFSYFDETLVPRTLSFAQDHWGYYNGNTSNTSMLPPISIDNGLTNLPGTFGNRDSKWPEMRAGALQKIQYPTGGHSRFAFESHNVYIPVNISDSTYIGQLSANYTQTSGAITFSVSQTTTMKARVNFPYYPNGQGNIHIINTSTNVDYGPGATQGLHIFQIPEGTYQFSVQSTSNTFYPVECLLYKINPGYQQLQSVTVGGLRMDSLIYNDGISDIQKIQTFDYVDENGTNQGVLFSRPAYVAMIKNYTIKEHGGIPTGIQYQTANFLSVNGCIASTGEPSNPTNFMYFISANAILPLVTSQGNHFGYNYVRVTEPDGGYTVYKFKPSGNPWSDVCVRIIDHNDCNDFLPNYPPAPEPFKPDRGEMISKSVYNSSNELIYREVFTNDYQFEQVGVQGLITKPHLYSSGQEDSSPGVAILTTEYEWKSARKVKSTVDYFTYDPTNTAVGPHYKKTETFFESIRHTQPSRTVLSDGAGKVLSEVRNTFIADLTVAPCPDIETGLSTIDANLISALATRATTYNPGSCAPNDSPCKLENWLRYTYYANLDRKASVNERITLINNYKACMTGTTANWSWASSSPEMQAIVKLKNRNQLHSIVERSQWRDGKFLSAELVTYQDFGNDTLSFFPGKLDIVKVASPLSAGSFTPVYLTTSIMIRDNKYSTEEIYSYESGNPVEILGKNGIMTSYIWDATINMPIVKAVGVSYATLNAAYLAVGGDLSTIRNQPSLASAQIITYTYDPLVGMTSMTDPNGVTSSYVYDKLGRLNQIKDKDSNIVQTHLYRYKTN